MHLPTIQTLRGDDCILPYEFFGRSLVSLQALDNHNTMLLILHSIPSKAICCMYHDQDPLAHYKWIVHSLDCCRAFNIQNKLTVVLTDQHDNYPNGMQGCKIQDVCSQQYICTMLLPVRFSPSVCSVLLGTGYNSRR